MTELLEMVIERDCRYDNDIDDEYIDVDDNDDDDVMIAEMMIMILMMMMMMMMIMIMIMIMRLKKRMRMRRWRRSIDESCTGIDISFKLLIVLQVNASKITPQS